MDGIYDVYLADRAIGKMYVDSQGLYLRFRCRCQLTGKVICKILVRDGKNTENLGVLVPMGGEFGLETRIPAKRFPEGAFEFQAVPRHSDLRGKFVPVSPQEPFSYLARLKTAYLQTRDGQLGVVLREDQ